MSGGTVHPAPRPRGVLRVLPSLTLLLCLAAAPAAAVTVAGVSFEPRIERTQPTLVLHNAALMRWKVLFKVYVAGLYLEPGAAPQRVLEDVPKRLEIEYLRGFTAEQFARSTELAVAANVDAATLERLRPRLAELNALYRSVEAGDRYALTYLPGVGTELSLNGEPLGRVEGADFATAVFSIWLGPRPVDAELKSRLLAAR